MHTTTTSCLSVSLSLVFSLPPHVLSPIPSSHQSTSSDSPPSFASVLPPSRSTTGLLLSVSPCPRLPVSTLLSPYVPLTLNSTSIHFLTTCPFLSLSVPPSLYLSRRSLVIWTDVSAELIIPSSCCLPATTHFPSCVAVSLPLCLSLSLSPPLSFPPSFTLSCLLPSLSPSSLPSLLHSHPLYSFPSETGLSERFSLLSTSSLMLFCLNVCVCVWCTLWCLHIRLCMCVRKC